MKPRDYHKYYGEAGDWALSLLKSVAGILLLAYLFYRSAWAILPLLPVGLWLLRKELKRCGQRYQERLAMQFKECILSVATALKAGYSVENALMESMWDMKQMYGINSMIYEELEILRRGLIINISPEEMLRDLGRRSSNEDISQFAEIFRIARSNGGNMPEIIRSTAGQIGNKIDVRMELHAALSGRLMEQRLMRFMPLAILLYIEISTPGYFDTLYHNSAGVGIMTVCLVLYMAAYALGDRIMEQIFWGKS